jgi:lysophospholipase L1-like esterase
VRGPRRRVLVVLAALLVLGAFVAVGVMVDAVYAPGRVGGSGAGPTTARPTTPLPAVATSAAKPPLRVVGLGDSVPAADTCGCAGFLEQLVPGLQDTTGRDVALRNDATSGWTTQDVLDDLAGGHTHADLVAGADLVVVEIGANDFDLSRLSDTSCTPAGTTPCFRATLAALRSGLTSVVDRVRALSPGARVALLGYWNVGVDGSVGRSLGSTYVASSDVLTRAVNHVVLGVAKDTGATYVDAYTPLKGASGHLDPTEDLLDDGDHPNASGHARLADAVLDALQSSGAVAGWKG